jgi:hypothetical protein
MGTAMPLGSKGQKMRKLFLFVFACSQMASAELEYQLGGAARSYPLSVAGEGALGYSYLLWGTAGGPEAPWFGLARAEAFYTTAFTYNALGAELSIAPISFLNLAYGAEMIMNEKNYASYDCGNYLCTGRFARTYSEFKFVYGAWDFFILAKLRNENWRSSATSQDFILPEIGLAADGDGDKIKGTTLVLGYKYSTEWTWALARVDNLAASDSSRSRQNLLLLEWGADPWRVTGGVGSFDSAIKHWGPTMVFKVVWRPEPRIGFF